MNKASKNRKGSLIVALLIISIMCVSFLVSCGEKETSGNQIENEESYTDANDYPDMEDTTEPKIVHNVPDIDFQGYNFRVVDRRGAIYWNNVDMYAETEIGEPINDAVYRRNRLLESKFNITVTELKQDDVLSFVQKIIAAGTDDFDVMYPNMQQAGSLVQKGYLTDLYTVPYLSFDKPWWNQVSNDSMSIQRKLYFAIGDIGIMDKDATWAILFNKDLNRDLGIEDPYQQVKNGTWTLDALYSNCKAATKDLNGDGSLTPEDQWGAVNQHECTYCLFAASGERVVQKDNDDLPTLSLNNDRTISVLNKTIDFLTDSTAQIKADDYYGKYADVWTEINVNSFREGRALYYISPIETVKFMRDMESNFGILPLPKYDESQKDYYNTLQYNNAAVMCVPITATDIERTGAILEAWSAESGDTLIKAYYDVNLKGKYSRDDESAEMLDLIFATRVIDQGLLFNWSGIQGFFQEFSQKGTLDFASQYEKSEPKWIIAIDKTIDTLTNAE